jgi:hypothetical protein
MDVEKMESNQDIYDECDDYHPTLNDIFLPDPDSQKMINDHVTKMD